MAKEKNAAAAPWWQVFRELFQLGIYKRSQGRIARQLTFAAVVVAFALGAWRLNVYEMSAGQVLRFGLPAALLVGGIWFSFRLVNIPSFADFLIAVEAEMNKVSWPTRTELFRSSLVVILLILFLAVILFAYDVFWRTLLDLLRVVNSGQ